MGGSIMEDKIKQLKQIISNRGKALAILIGNQKGGVGKTANTTLIAYTLAQYGFKVLVADLDPQSNATKILALTKSQNSDEVYIINKTMMRGVQDQDLTDLPINIMPNLDLLPSNTDFKNFGRYLYINAGSDRYKEDHMLAPLFEPLKKQYDILMVDTPPFNTEIDNNAPVFCDYVIISLQTEEDSFVGANVYVQTLLEQKKKYDLPIEIVGILPMLNDKWNSVDKKILEDACDSFGKENIFQTIIPRMDRIKRFPINGITDRDKFDKKVLNKYKEVTNELIQRLIEFEV